MFGTFGTIKIANHMPANKYVLQIRIFETAHEAVN